MCLVMKVNLVSPYFVMCKVFSHSNISYAKILIIELNCMKGRQRVKHFIIYFIQVPNWSYVLEGLVVMVEF